MIREYKILTYMEPQYLADEVNKLLSDLPPGKWTLHGNMTVTKTNGDHPLFAQAMVRND